MIVYMTQGQKTVLSRITVEGLPLHYLSVGRGYFARRRALHCLRQMYDSGVRRCICADVYLLSLAKQADITSYPVLPLRLALLGSLLDILCPGGLQNAAAVLRCGPGGEETARAALTVLARRCLLYTSPEPTLRRWRRSYCTAGGSPPETGAGGRR